MNEARKKTNTVLTLLLAVLLITGLCLFPFPVHAEGPEGDDYPEELKEAGKDSLVDPWNFYNRECVSFVAWRLNDRNGLAFDGANLFLGFTFWGGILAALLVGGILGAFNGWMVTRFKVPPFVATLGMMTIARGLTMLYTGGFPITGLGKSFQFLGTGWLLGIPMPVWVAALIIAFFAFYMKKTPTGRYIYAIGGNPRASLLSGIRVDRIILWVYTLAGLLSAVAGLLVTARLDSAQPNAGTGYELDAIAAVVIGGTSLSGGKGSVLGTVVGALIIGVLNNGLVLLNVSPFWQQVIKGFVILGAVIIDKYSTRKQH